MVIDIIANIVCAALVFLWGFLVGYMFKNSDWKWKGE